MLFNSFSFAVFLPIVFTLYWAFPKKCQWVILLLSSYLFYMCWKVEYVFLILLTTAVSYTCALMIEKYPRYKKLFLPGALLISLGVLFFFKYFNFFSNSLTNAINGIFALEGKPILANVILPVGISFYTFQTLSYVIDVYRGSVAAERHFGKYATFISFFPQLVAGPIERTHNLLGQIKAEHDFHYDQAAYGVRLMLWGFFKKMVVADNLAVFVDVIYDAPTQYSGAALVLATVFFAIQIYCDFSGYSDIAIGVGKLFGIDLMKNFDAPYFAVSIKDFWSRWHISLSTWFKDYVYIPLGGNRVSSFRHKINLIITFLISGLWHGANWTYVVWGGIHGAAQALEAAIPKRRLRPHNRISGILRGTAVFVFVVVAWVFFRAQSISDAGYILANGFTGILSPITYLRKGFLDMGMGISRLVICVISVLMLFCYDALSRTRDVITWIGNKKPIVSWSVGILLVLLIMAWTPLTSGSEFIYFQF